MATARVIQGTGEELMEQLQDHRHDEGLTLIIPESSNSASLPSEPSRVRNGVPLFPRPKTVEPVTLEAIRRLEEEE
jgi:hypothetical protein